MPVKAPADLIKLERDLRAIMRRYGARETALEEARAERDRIIRDAHKAGMTPTQIGALTDLTAQRIQQIAKPTP